MATQTQTKPDPRLLYNQGVALLEAGRPNEALARFMMTIVNAPFIAEAWWQAALIFIEADNMIEGLRHAEQAVKLRPEEPTVWATWADAVALSGDAAAEARFLAELKKSKLAPAMRLRLQDRFGAQRKASRGATGKAPAARLEAIATLIRTQDFPRAEAECVRLLREVSDSASLHNMAGIVYSARGNGDLAMQHFKAAVRIDPFFADAFFNMARTYAAANMPVEAQRMARAAIARAPSHGPSLMLYGDLMVDDLKGERAIPYLERALAAGHRPGTVLRVLGHALIDARDYERAEEVLTQALEKGSDSEADTLSALAHVRMRAGRPEQALVDVDHALALDPDNVAAIGRKAMTLQTLGRFEEARPLFRRAMDLDPTNGDLFRSYMTGNKAKPGDDVVERMIGLIEQPGLTPRKEAGFGFAIAKGLEDQKDFTRAFPYLKRANDLMTRVSPYDHQARLDEIARTKQAFANAQWSRKVEGAGDAAPIFITGMPRSGTTLIEQIISSHSRVTGGDEMDILPRHSMKTMAAGGRGFHPIGTIPDADIAALGRGYAAEVEKRFPGADIVTDKSITSYMYLGLTKLALPNARFIIVRRDPRDNLLSIYRNRFPEGAHQYAYDLRALAEYYATFVEMVEFWRAETPHWFTEVQYETLVANPEEETRRLIAACGLDWEESCLNFHRNERQVRTLSVYQVRQPISGGSVKAWQRYEKELAPMIEVLAERGLLPD